MTLPPPRPDDRQRLGLQGVSRVGPTIPGGPRAAISTALPLKGSLQSPFLAIAERRRDPIGIQHKTLKTPLERVGEPPRRTRGLDTARVHGMFAP